MFKKGLIMLAFSMIFVEFITAQVDTGPTKFENTSAAGNAKVFDSAEEFVEYDENGRFEIGKYYIVRCSVLSYSGTNYQLNIGTTNLGRNYISINVIYGGRSEWTNQFNQIVALLLYREDRRFYCIEMIRNFQVRTIIPASGGLMSTGPKEGTRPSTLQDWLTGTTDERGIGQPTFDFQRNETGLTITGYNGTEKNVIIPNEIDGVRVTVIGNNALRMKGLTSVTIPNNVTVIGTNAFYANSLTSINIPASVTTIGMASFSRNNLTSVSIPEGVTTIENHAFSGNKITNLVIPRSVREIGEYAFGNMEVTTISVGDNVNLETAFNNEGTYERNNRSRRIANKFGPFYNSINKKGGTYIYDGNEWK
jgi:hypothetical protein